MPNNYGIKIIVVILILFTIFTFAGCRYDEKANNNGELEFTYVSQYIPLPRNIGEISNLAFHDDRFYFVVSNYTPPNSRNYYTPTGTVSVYSMNSDGSELVKLDNYSPSDKKPTGANEYTRIYAMSIDADGYIWLVQI